MAAGVFHKRKGMRTFSYRNRSCNKCPTKANYSLANNMLGANGHGIRVPTDSLPANNMVGANGHGIRVPTDSLPANNMVGANGHGIRQHIVGANGHGIRQNIPTNTIVNSNPTMGSYKNKIPRIKSVRIPIERIKPL